MADVMTTTTWAPRGAWAGILQSGHRGTAGKSGVRVEARDGLGIASLIAPASGDAPLAAAMKARLGLDLPSTPAVASSRTHAAVWAGPGQWLLVANDRTGFADALQALSDVAAVADQSSGRAALRVSGAAVRNALAKGCMLDLHPAAFPIGMAALTSIAHIGVHLWRAEDGPEGAVFEIMVARSFAGSFWSWLSASVAEFGCDIIANEASTGRG
ncbi:MAG TPA: sarcosine oxidase subunit gamma family protein [Bosea sp. (in: a-proteobacteria)]|jgi:sarcosine oxidase subunit gamma|uniref:sarcosine oxidase subunit gamma n=1 Tax=Bosea sp. (in: a-proteobacteria) TaxID=1871050 RepID=UPI002E136FAE|nr:sarcosine oxidase subunit gamma family protein [Bosea sp. (in: a-proteobacteria)]